MKKIKLFLIWLKNAILTIISVPAYIILAIAILLIAVIELGKSETSILQIIKAIKDARK